MSGVLQSAQYIIHRQSLPIVEIKNEFIQAFEKHKVVIVTGATGSGKTTQIPQYIYDNRLAKSIIVTQPRRVAAISLATRMAEEQGCELGDEIGYVVRFDSKRGPDTKITVATDGILLNEVANDSILSKYDAIILDEVHTRSMNTDTLLGVIKAALETRNDLKVVIMSATLLPEKFKNFFDDVVHIEAPGKLHKVDIEYRPATEDLADSIVDEVMRIARDGYKDMPIDGEIFVPSNILVFLSGEEEIHIIEEKLRETLETETLKIPVEILKVYGAMKDVEQRNIFTPTTPYTRRVILATNIAETSLTIPNIVYVIDSGFHKIKKYDPLNKKSALVRCPASKSNLNQRSGRAGRVCAGVCIRMFPESEYVKLPLETPPEILRSDISTLLLSLFKLEFNPFTFDFIDPPSTIVIKQSLKELTMMGCWNNGKLTPLGNFCASLPISVSESLCLYRAAEYRVLDEVSKIVALLSSNTIFESTTIWRIFSAKLRPFRAKNSDHLSLLKMIDNYLLILNEKENQLAQNVVEQEMREWCADNYVNYRAFSSIRSVASQLMKITSKFKIRYLDSSSTMTRDERIKSSLAYGFMLNTAIKKTEIDDNIESFHYVSLQSNTKVTASRSPFADTTHKPEFLIYTELFCNVSRSDMRYMTEVNPMMLYRENKMIYKYWVNTHPDTKIREQLKMAILEQTGKQRRD